MQERPARHCRAGRAPRLAQSVADGTLGRRGSLRQIPGSRDLSHEPSLPWQKRHAPAARPRSSQSSPSSLSRCSSTSSSSAVVGAVPGVDGGGPDINVEVNPPGRRKLELTRPERQSAPPDTVGRGALAYSRCAYTKSGYSVFGMVLAARPPVVLRQALDPRPLPDQRHARLRQTPLRDRPAARTPGSPDARPSAPTAARPASTPGFAPAGARTTARPLVPSPVCLPRRATRPGRAPASPRARAGAGTRRRCR